MTPPHYLSVCTMYRDHASYLAEWLEFHLLVGAEHFYLYDNGSADDHLDVLRPYLDEGLVELHDWPLHPGMKQAFDHCVEQHRTESRWIAFIDIDEFLFSPTGTPLPEVLRDYEDFPGVGVNRVPFGPSGHETRPPGLVIESYVRRPKHMQTAIKSIVDPTAVEENDGAHKFTYRDGRCAVDELERVLDPSREVPPEVALAGKLPKPNSGFTESLSMERLRINHYLTKSREEWEEKIALPRPDSGEKRPEGVNEKILLRLDGEPDDQAIMQFVPALKQALAARRQAVG
jgi:glycosyl transferase family 92